ncbi:MAG: GNAT family N-acetyltransferase [Candidatus Bathyarchaeia archaeon]
MKPDSLNQVRITELAKDDPSLPKLNSRYSTTSYYDLAILQEYGAWKIDLALKPLEKPMEKSYTGTFFEAHIEEPRAFSAAVNGNQVGWVELGYEKWNNRMRVWEFLVKEDFRRMGVGGLLTDFAIRIAREKGERMLVLETQSYNVPAISFYLKKGFKLIGLDSTAYSNEDAIKREVRLEFGLVL